jgi:hypothetical protein
MTMPLVEKTFRKLTPLEMIQAIHGGSLPFDLLLVAIDVPSPEVQALAYSQIQFSKLSHDQQLKFLDCKKIQHSDVLLALSSSDRLVRLKAMEHPLLTEEDVVVFHRQASTLEMRLAAVKSPSASVSFLLEIAKNGLVDEVIAMSSHPKKTQEMFRVALARNHKLISENLAGWSLLDESMLMRCLNDHSVLVRIAAAKNNRLNEYPVCYSFVRYDEEPIVRETAKKTLYRYFLNHGHYPSGW